MNRNSKVKRGDIYWVENRILENSVINFDNASSGNLHPVVVVRTRFGKANIRVMTSKIERYDNRGIIYKPTSDVMLKRTGVIVGAKGLKQIRKSERKEVYGDLSGSRFRKMLWLVVIFGILAIVAYYAYTRAGLPISL